MLEVCWDGLWTLSFGLSQFHSHGSWLVCEVALRLARNLNLFGVSIFGFVTISTPSLHLHFHLLSSPLRLALGSQALKKMPWSHSMPPPSVAVWPPPLSFSRCRSLSVAEKGTLNMICSVTYSLELHICIYFSPSNVISYQVMPKQSII